MKSVTNSTNKQNKTLGAIGEKLACYFLHQKGYRILKQNYYCHWGEIDIIAEKDDVLTFVEVKTRLNEEKGKPYEAVTYGKLARLRRPIQLYLLQYHALQKKCSLDVISILLNSQYNIEKIDHFQNLSLTI